MAALKAELMVEMKVDEKAEQWVASMVGKKVACLVVATVEKKADLKG